MLEIGGILTLNNGKEYVIANMTTLNNVKYLYLITLDGVSDVMLCSLNNNKLTTVTDGEVVARLFEIFKDGGN